MNSTTRLDIRPLWRGAGMEIVTTSWRRDRHPAASESATGVAAIEFMLAGSFRKETDRDAVVGDANTAVMFRPGERFCIDHPAGAGNAGLTIRFTSASWRAASIAERSTWPVPAATCAQVNALAAGLSRPECHDATDVESHVSELLSHWLDLPVTAFASVGRRERDGVRFVQSHLSSVLDRPVSLAELAGLVDWSPWHLVRAFQRHAGLSPYRYHVRLRLRAACREVIRGREELTMVALRFGFSSHSHFTAAFRREFGMTPSAMRLNGSTR